jgi:ribosomal protein L3 glutamine methyltransferase
VNAAPGSPAIDLFAAERAVVATVRDLVRVAVTAMGRVPVFHGHGWPDALSEAQVLVRHTLHLPYGGAGDALLDARVTAAEVDAVLARLALRTRDRLPLPYVLGEAWLGDLRFRVDPRVLIPRSYVADLLPDALAPWCPDLDAIGSILDLCTGSGCLAIVAATAWPLAEVVAADLSPDALAVARTNIADHGLEARVRVAQGDLFGAVAPDARFDLIVANPPYVTAASMAALPPEYRHEPALALAAGDDGLDLVRRLLAQAADHLTADGVLVVEVGHARDRVEAAFRRLPFTWLETVGGDDAVFLLTRADLDAAR